MRMHRLQVLLAIAPALAVLPVLAADGVSGKTVVTARDNAVEKIEAATARQVEILTGLLSKVPEQAQPAIEKAIAAAQSGHDGAVAALTLPGDVSGSGGSAGSSSAPLAGTTESAGKPETTGLERARAAVAAGFDKGTSTLQGLLDKVPANVASRIEAALDRLDGNRTAALRNLDSLIAGERPEHPASQSHPDRPEHPSRPDRAERPEHPERPQLPERPQVPDHPTPHG